MHLQAARPFGLYCHVGCTSQILRDQAAVCADHMHQNRREALLAASVPRFPALRLTSCFVVRPIGCWPCLEIKSAQSLHNSTLKALRGLHSFGVALSSSGILKSVTRAKL